MQAQRKKYVFLGIALLLILTMASACGDRSKDESGNNGTTGTPTVTSADKTDTNSATDAPAATDDGTKAATRVVSTVNGDVEIPAEPKRIVALYYHHILLAFDIKPVGANLTWWGGSPFLKDMEADGIVDVGGPPSLEAVAKLEPDLIIMNSNNAEDYEQFAKIAPSVLIPYDANRSTYDDAKLVGELIGKPQAAEQLMASFEEKAAAAHAKIAGTIDENAKVAIIRIEGKGSEFSIFGYNYGRGGWSVYRGLNLKMPEKIEKELESSGTQIVQKLSLELLPEYVADADYILVSNEGEGTDLVSGSAVWKTIPAVKNKKVMELDGKQYFYFDPISIEAQLDLITEMLLSHK
ncbi:ABC transporter substrate-binding protein [Paenibacillus eucommiae]|uniref:Iron complex transport system substrate-binding protein n=1 Tax=Paenibacillus eucommiae TaxID=1355755 RepID=A0ABS4J7C9_9BACL|nr:ABC transporter substrate-binding protein [Paenibacillus eucommiae]MBP1995754.1 iron complex transport system substrate-binding protein [Paenibacillus eucommiae]